MRYMMSYDLMETFRNTNQWLGATARAIGVYPTWSILTEADLINQEPSGIQRRLNITQPRVSALMQGKIEDFRLDTLVNLAHRSGLHVRIEIAA